MWGAQELRQILLDTDRGVKITIVELKSIESCQKARWLPTISEDTSFADIIPCKWYQTDLFVRVLVFPLSPKVSKCSKHLHCGEQRLKRNWYIRKKEKQEFIRAHSLRRRDADPVQSYKVKFNKTPISPDSFSLGLAFLIPIVFKRVQLIRAD